VFAFAFCLLLLPLSLSAQRVISEISGNFDTFGLAINNGEGRRQAHARPCHWSGGSEYLSEP
jgi:hypothetical protein